MNSVHKDSVDEVTLSQMAGEMSDRRTAISPMKSSILQVHQVSLIQHSVPGNLVRTTWERVNF